MIQPQPNSEGELGDEIEKVEDGTLVQLNPSRFSISFGQDVRFGSMPLKKEAPKGFVLSTGAFSATSSASLVSFTF
jgi:hypothetical protein